MSIIDSPDGQYAVVNSAVLLASVAANTQSVTVTLPANVTSLMVVTSTTSGLGPTLELLCTGATTGIQYPGSLRYNVAGVGAFPSVFFTVAPSLDNQVTVKWSAAQNLEWYVVGLTGVNLLDVPALSSSISYTGELAAPTSILVAGESAGNQQPLQTDTSGNLLVKVNDAIPTQPTTSVGPILVSSNTLLLAAPGSGHNYIFSIDVSNNGAATSGLVWFAHGTAGGTVSQVNFPGNVPCSIDVGGVEFADALLGNAASANIYVTVRYAVGP